MNKSILLAALLFMPAMIKAADVTVRITNTENVQRQELVEVDAKSVTQKLGIKSGETFIVKNALLQEVGYQLTYDGKLIIDASVRPYGTAEFFIEIKLFFFVIFCFSLARNYTSNKINLFVGIR